MSPIGRIFIVLNLVLSAVFLGFASNNLASSQDFKGQFEDKRDEHDQYRETKEVELGDLTAQIAQLESSSSSLREQRDGFKAEMDRLKTDYETERRRNNTLNADVSAIKETLANYDETNRQNVQRLEQANSAVAEATSAKRDAEDAKETALDAQRTADEQLTAASKSIVDLEIDRETLRKVNANLDAQLQTLAEATGTKLADLMPMPLIDGAVLQVVALGNDMSLIAINKGEEHGVKRGFTFEIHRGSQYKGQARVENVQAGMCSAIVIRTVDGQTIGQGDLASTRL